MAEFKFFQFFFLILSLKSFVTFANSKLVRYDGYYGLRKDIEKKMTFIEKTMLRQKEEEDPEWMEQPLDHFDKNNTSTWLMRYYSNLKQWEPGGPIVIFIGGEFSIVPAFVYGGITFDLGTDLHGAMFAIEHRFYGKSIPNPRDYKYLTSEQGVADVVTFIETLKSDPKYANSKVVVIGGSYPGILASRLRQFHSDVVDAAVASSAPLLAKVDFYEFIETTEQVFANHGTPDCLNNIRKAFKNYIRCFKIPECAKGLIKEYQLCEDTDLSKRKNQFSFIAQQSYMYDNMVQYGTIDIIQNKCGLIDKFFLEDYKCNSNATNEKSYAKLGLSLEKDEDEDSQCISVDFFYLVERWSDPWTYQTCNEFGYFATTHSSKQVYGNKMPLKAFLAICSMAFGINDVHQRVKKTNQRYGALRPNVTKVVYTNGSLDPWHKLGLTKSFNDDIPVLFIPNASHTQDMSTIYNNDSEALIEARQITKSYIKEWIKI